MEFSIEMRVIGKSMLVMKYVLMYCGAHIQLITVMIKTAETELAIRYVAQYVNC